MNQDRACFRARNVFLLSCVFLLLLGGCGARNGDLMGTITHEGKPVRMGSVLIMGSDGVPRSTTIRDDGTYSIGKVPVGVVQIAISSPDPESVFRSSPKRGGGNPKPKPDSTKWFAIPDKYGDFDRSELTFTVSSGSNRFNIDLR